MRKPFITKLFIICNCLGLVFFARSQPNTISGLSLWLKSDFGVTFNGSSIMTWQDASGNNNHCIQNDSNFQPTLYSSISQINNQSSVFFDGIDDYMEFSNRLTNIRTVFFIVKHTNGVGSNLYQPILGDSQTYDFIGDGGNGNKLFDASITSPFILNGSIRLNQIPVSPVSNVNKPIQYSMLSLTTTGNVAADRITRDRTNTNRVWDGEYSEIIIYNRVLTTLEINNVENYLINKYSPTLDLGADIEIPPTSGCTPSYSIAIIGTPNFKNYLWSNGSINSSISASQYGEYSLICTDIFDIKHYDTIHVIPPKLNFDYPNKVLCQNSSIIWNTNLPKSDFNFQWQDNSTDSVFNITQAGNYYVNITDNFGCSVNTNTVSITEDNFPTTTTLGPDVSLCVGNEISIQTNTTSAITYTWSDGSHNPNLIINATGQYFVAVTNTNNCIAKDTINVTVLGQAPTVAFNNSIGCRGNVITFNNLSYAPSGNTITNIYWNFGNPSSTSNTTSVTNPTHTYADTGTYVVSLKINTDVGCSNTLSQNLHVAPNPTVNFVFATPCQNDSTAFASVVASPVYTITSKYWNFGDLTSGPANNSTLSNPKHLFSSQTNYTTSLVVTNSEGCKDSIAKVISVRAQVTANFNYTAPCINTFMKFTDNSIVPNPNNTNIRQWSFGNTTATGTVVNQFYSIASVHPVTLTVIGNNGCNSTSIKQVTVNLPPNCNFTNLSSVCAFDSLLLTDASTGNSAIQQWKWTHNSTLFSNAPNTYFKNSIAGNKSIQLKVTDINGCVDSISKNITVNPLPNISFTTSPTDVFANATVTLIPTNSTAVSYSWLGTNNFNSNLAKPLYTFGDTGVYTFTLSIQDINGCKNKSILSVNANNKRTDLGIIDVTSQLQNDGYLDLIVRLANLGSAPITQFKINALVINSSSVKEQWIGTLQKGEVFDYHFTSSILANDANKHQLNCVEITEVNNSYDDNSQNNKYCIELHPNGNKVYEAYPNPTSKDIYFPIALKNDANINIEITNSLGEKTYSDNKNANAGLSVVTVPTSSFAKGCYICKITIGDKLFIQKIVRD